MTWIDALFVIFAGLMVCVFLVTRIVSRGDE